VLVARVGNDALGRNGQGSLRLADLVVVEARVLASLDGEGVGGVADDGLLARELIM